MAVRIHLTGQLRVTSGEVTFEDRHFPSRQARLVFAYLAAHRHHGVPRDELAEVLWPGGPPPAWQRNLSVILSRLRTLFAALPGAPDILINAFGCCTLRLPADSSVDLEEAVTAADQAEASLGGEKPVEAIAHARRAVELSRGPVLPGEEGRWLEQLHAERRRLLLRALDVMVDAGLAAGKPGVAVLAAEEAVGLEPYREIGHQQLIRSLAARGDRAQALKAYQRCRQLLVEELGVPPSSQTEAVYVQILRSDLVGQMPARPPLGAILAARSSAPFVGRETELKTLESHLDALAAGRPRLALLTGEPGIGKTALSARFALAAHQRGGMVLVGRCDGEVSLPYQPFVEALTQLLGQISDEELKAHVGSGGQELARLLPRLAERLPHLSHQSPGEPEGERYRLFATIAGALAGVSVTGPVVLILEDLQWADKGTLLLLRHLLRYAGHLALLLVVTCRSTDLRSEAFLAEVLSDLRRDDLVAELSLSGLDDGEVATLVESALGPEVDRATIARVIETSEGNPLFIRELLRHFSEKGDDVAIPQGIKNLMGRRLVGLSGEAQEILALAAVTGREFGLGVLSRISDHDEDRLLVALEDAVRARVLTEAIGAVDHWAFSHALMRETLYGDVSASRRARLHTRIGEAIEKLFSEDLGSHLSELAHHYACGAPASESSSAKAVEYARRAGDQAMGQLAFERAAALYQLAFRHLAALGPEGDQLRCTLLLAVGDARARAGNPEAREAYLGACELGERCGDRRSVTLARIGLIYWPHIPAGRPAPTPTC